MQPYSQSITVVHFAKFEVEEFQQRRCFALLCASLLSLLHALWSTLTSRIFVCTLIIYETQDTRRDYGEARMIGFAYIGLRLCCVVYADRCEERRIISLRKANKREVTRYAKT